MTINMQRYNTVQPTSTQRLLVGKPTVALGGNIITDEKERSALCCFSATLASRYENQSHVVTFKYHKCSPLAIPCFTEYIYRGLRDVLLTECIEMYLKLSPVHTIVTGTLSPHIPHYIQEFH